jgi:hypothetical protein
MKENQKVLVKNLTNHEVGFKCTNFPATYNFNPGQVINVKWEHLEDASYSRGMRYMLTNGILRIEPKTENYSEIMDELQLTDLKEVIDNSITYEEAKKLLSIVPIQVNYGIIKKHLEKGTITTKQNIASAAIELGIKDYTLNTLIKKATNIDVIKTLELNEAPEKEE